ncbi:nitrate reductase [Rhodovarius crocodyli]|uniref:Nitrate reductase n=1 Tax=Rhodovarius crocodyli TaxID=1979269 RepID=A0A437MNP1_9PROT|nr:molybdopterin-dependent oxidoreductase [Rhodovarius crocodyli]RVT99249.1 nitrate reductase [Rhodovarius crocodyli]
MTTRTTCPYCGVGCGVLATPGAPVKGDTAHPANRGRLCSKGTALGETLNHPNRLLFPEVDGKRASWDAALDAMAEGFRTALNEHGPDGVALYVSGQLLTEDYYAANKFAKGFLGTANIDSNSRLCMASAVAGHRRAFGEDLVPGIYDDLEQADLLVLLGSNTAWCHPVLFQRIQAARAAGKRIVVIDPRRTATCEGADLHLALRPGSDVALYLGLLAHLHSAGFPVPEAALEPARGLDVPALTGLSAQALATFYAWFAATPRTVTLFSQGANQSSAGADKANAIINAHVAHGSLGLPGGGPFSVTGQPNAMGGREVGALANMLAGHLEWDRPGEFEALRDYWQAPRLAPRAGLKAVDLFNAAAEGRIGALWVMATNPAVSMPAGDTVRQALKCVPMLAVSDCVADSDTLALARIRLPALGWGEKDGTVTNSERVMSRQRRFLPAPGEARQDWWIVSQVAARLGWGRHFAWKNPAAIFREHAALTGLARPANRVFDISGLADLTDAEYDAMEPTRWPVARRGELGGRLAPAARFVPTAFRAPVNAPGGDLPFILNTGRLRDQWHTMTRTGQVPRLMAHVPEPFLAMHPADAVAPDGALVRVEGSHGQAVLRLRHDAGQRQGEVFAPMHWTEAFAQGARINSAVNPAVDPVSGQPELKHSPVAVEPFPIRWQGFVLARRQLSLHAAWQAVVPLEGGVWRHELAGGDAPAQRFAALRDACALPDAAWVVLEDAAGGHFRAAALKDGRLLAVVFIAPDHLLPPREWLAGLFAETAIGSAARRTILAGAPASGPAPSPTICVCNGVSRATIEAAIEGGCCSVAAVGETTHAGTGCGSCRPEIASLIAVARQPEPA